MSVWSILRPRPEGKQHAERRQHPHQPALLVGGLQHDHGEADIWSVFGGHALDQRALLGLGAGRGVAADLPVAMHRAHDALRRTSAAGPQARRRVSGQRHVGESRAFNLSSAGELAAVSRHGRNEAGVQAPGSMSRMRRALSACCALAPVDRLHICGVRRCGADGIMIRWRGLEPWRVRRGITRQHAAAGYRSGGPSPKCLGWALTVGFGKGPLASLGREREEIGSDAGKSQTGLARDLRTLADAGLALLLAFPPAPAPPRDRPAVALADGFPDRRLPRS